MFRIDKSSVSYKNGEQPYVLAHAALKRHVPAPLPVKEEASAQAAAPPEPQPVLPDPAELAAAAQREADALIVKAKEQAAMICAQAALEADEAKRAAFADGMDHGYREGHAAGRGEGIVEYRTAIGDAQALLRQAMGRVEAERREMLSGVERQCVELSMEIARKVLGAAMATDENAFPSLVRRALEDIQHTGKVTLRVSPLEYDLFFSQGAGWVSDETLSVSVIEDDELAEGDLKLESDVETINAGVRSQMDAIREALLKLGGGA